MGENNNIVEQLNEVKKLLRDFNTLIKVENNKKVNILKSIFGFCGNDVWIERGFDCKYGKNIFIGNSTTINKNCTIYDENKIIIGKNTIIGSNTKIYTSLSSTDDFFVNDKHKDNFVDFMKSEPIIIGDNVWIGDNVCILPGINIGDGSVVSSGCIVNKSVPSESVAIGESCLIIKAK